MFKLIKKIKNYTVGVKSAAAYTLSSLFTRGLAVITVPIFTRLMTTEQIGVVNIYNSWYALISAFTTLSLTSGGFAVAMKEYEHNRDEYESSVLTLTSLVAIIIIFIYYGAPLFWQNILGLPNALVSLMLIGLIVAPARDFWLARQRYEYKYKLSVTISILTAVVASGLSIFVVIYLTSKNSINTALGRLYANYVVIYGVAAFFWFYIMLKGKKFYSRKYWKMSLAISIPLVGYNIAGQILNVSDRMMISNMVDNKAVGIYSTLYTVSALSIIVWQAINASFVPYLFQNLEKKKHNIKEYANMIMIAYALVAIILMYFAPEIIHILATKEYYEAIFIMPPIASGVFFTSFANLYSNIAVYYKKTKYVMYPAFVAAIINVGLNYIFIKKFGYIAAAYTTLISYIVLAFLQVTLSKKVCTENNKSIEQIFDNRTMLILALLIIAISLVGILLYKINILRYTVVVLCIFITTVIEKNIIKKL